MKKSIEIVIEDETWKEIDGYSDWNKSLDALFQETTKKMYRGNKGCWIGLLLTDDPRIKILNRNFRNVNKPTNVLSFPEHETEFWNYIGISVEPSEIFLGDIAMSREQIMRECKEYGISFFNRCSHLFVHGVLHLFGADHIEPKEQEEMESMEIEILKEFGMSNPYVLEGENK